MICDGKGLWDGNNYFGITPILPPAPDVKRVKILSFTFCETNNNEWTACKGHGLVWFVVFHSNL